MCSPHLWLSSDKSSGPGKIDEGLTGRSKLVESPAAVGPRSTPQGGSDGGRRMARSWAAPAAWRRGAWTRRRLEARSPSDSIARRPVAPHLLPWWPVSHTNETATQWAIAAWRARRRALCEHLTAQSESAKRSLSCDKHSQSRQEEGRPRPF